MPNTMQKDLHIFESLGTAAVWKALMPIALILLLIISQTGDDNM